VARLARSEFHRRTKPERAKHVVFGLQSFSDGGSTPPASTILPSVSIAAFGETVDTFFEYQLRVPNQSCQGSADAVLGEAPFGLLHYRLTNSGSVAARTMYADRVRPLALANASILSS